MFKNFLPHKFFLITNKKINYLIFVLLILVSFGLIYSLFLSPADYVQGDSVRIMYVHVPASFLALIFFGLISMASILSLIFKIKFMPIFAKSLAPIGFTFSAISIVTGSFWGKPTWGVWWVWDARLTSMMVLLFFYIAYILSWKFIKNYKKANTATSIIAIVGMFNLPIIKYSVNWWNTLHQPSSITLTSAPTIHHTMLVPLVIMFFGMLIYSLIIFLMSYKAELLKFKIKKKLFK